MKQKVNELIINQRTEALNTRREQLRELFAEEKAMYYWRKRILVRELVSTADTAGRAMSRRFGRLGRRGRSIGFNLTPPAEGMRLSSQTSRSLIRSGKRRPWRREHTS